MANPLRVTIENGPKGKKLAAIAPDWPGLERGGKTEVEATQKLQSYLPRYAKIAKLAGMEFAADTPIEIVEHYTGPGSTDFWGISFGFSSIDKEEVSSGALERELTLMQACWAFFDQVRSRVSAELQKGPRGGGRDRDRIIRHVVLNEQDWGRGLGLPGPDLDAVLTEEKIRAHREDYCNGIRAFHAEGKMAKKWPLRYMIRHTAYHTLDHTWEMEDKDLTGKVG